MDGIHDMGGMQGFGPIRPEKNAPVFHARWEGRITAIYSALGASGKWAIDFRRQTKESTPWKEKEMPTMVHVSLDGRSRARVREFDFDLTKVPVSTRTAKRWSLLPVTRSVPSWDSATEFTCS